MRLSFPPLKLWLALVGLSLAVSAQTTGVLVPPIYQVAAANANATGAGIGTDAQGNLYVPVTGGVAKVSAPGLGVGTVNASFITGVAQPAGAAVDAQGNVWVANYGAGEIEEFPNTGGSSAVKTLAQDSPPVTLAVSPSGTVYFTDGTNLYALAAGASSAKLLDANGQSYDGIAVAPNGTVLVSDLDTGVVYAFAPTGAATVGSRTVFAGGGSPDSGNGDGGSATAASLNAPVGIAADASGNVYILEYPGAFDLREVNRSGIINTVAGAPGGSFNAFGITQANFAGSAVPGPASEVALTNSASVGSGSMVGSLGFAPGSLSLDRFGRLLMAQADGSVLAMPTQANFGAEVVGKLASQYWFFQNTQTPTAQGAADTLAAAPVTVTAGPFAWAGGGGTAKLGATLCAGGGATEAIVDGTPRNKFCEIDLTYTASAVGVQSTPLSFNYTDGGATTLTLPLTGTGLAPIAAGAVGQINTPIGSGVSGAGINGLAVNPWGTVFVGDWLNKAIEQVDGGELLTLISGSSLAGGPTGIAFDPSGNLYFADASNNELREIPVIISSTGAWSYGTGTPAVVVAGLNNPEGIAADAYGDIYIADRGNQLVKEYIPGDATPVIVAGGGSGALGGPATGIAITPAGVAIDASGNLYIADQSSNRILRVSGGIVTAVETSLPSTVWLLALDPGGNLYAQTVAGTYLITAPASASPVMTLIAGSGASGAAAGDGGPANAATFANGIAIAVAPSMNANGVGQSTIYIGDYGTTSGADELRTITTANGAYATPAFASIAANPVAPPSQTVTLLNQGTAPLTWSAPNSSGPFYPSFVTAAWTASTAYTAGQEILDANGNLESVTAAGTSGSATPVWSAAANGTTTDGTVTWTNQGLACSSTTALAAGANCQAVVTFDPSGTGSWAFTPPPPSEAMPFGYSFASNTAGASPSTLDVYAAGTAAAPAAVPTALTVTPASASVSAGSVITALQVTVNDQNGNPIASGNGATDSLTIAVASGPGSLAAGTPTVPAVAGVANFNNLVLDVAGTYTLTVTDNTNPSVTSVNVTIQVNDGPPAAVTLVSGGGQSTFVSTNFPVALTFTVTDAGGNILTDAPVTVTAPSSGASATFIAPPSTDVTGTVIVAAAANATAGSYDLTVTSGAAFGVAALTNLPANVTTFTSEPVTTPPTTSPTQPISFTFTSPTAVASATVVTQGYTGRDFQGTTTACVGSFAAGQGCTVNVSFAPEAVGGRQGAVILYDASGNVLQTVYINGVGQGAEIAFGNAPQTAYSAVPAGSQIAVDPKGDIFFVNGALYELPNNNGVLGALQTYPLSISYGSAAAFDGAGNLYLSGANTEYKLPVVNGVPQMSQLQTHGVGTLPNGIPSCNENAVDGNGNVFLACSQELVELPAGTFAPRVVLAYGANLNVQSIAMDSADDVYIGAANSNTLYEVQNAASANPTLQTYNYSAQLLTPWALGMDPAGDLYFGNGAGSSTQIYELANVGGAINYASPVAVAGAVANSPRSLGFDAFGNMIVAQVGSVVVLQQAVPAALANFGGVVVNQTSPAESQTISNIGNQPLYFDSIGFAAPFSYANGQSCIIGPSPTAAGASCTVAVQFTPTAVGSATGSVTVTDNAANETAPQSIGLSGTGVAITQTITFNLATPVTYGAGPITLSGTGGASGSPVTFSILSGGQYATLSGTNSSILTITGAGTVTVAADQAATGNYAAATEVTQTLVITQAADTLTLGAVPTQTYPVASPITLSAAGTSTGAITYTVIGPATISGNNLSITGAGTVVVTANQAADGNYLAGTATENITVNKAADTLNIGAVPTQTYPVSTPIGLSATGSSTGAITYTVTGPATISGSTLTITGAGTVVVTATQAADGNYLQGTATENITVNKGADTLTIGAITTQTYPVSTPIGLSATGASTGAITYTVTGPATVSGSTLTITGAGAVVVTATQAADSNYLQGTATENITVNQAADTLTIGAVGTQTYPVSSTIALSATGSSTGAITYTVTGPATVSGSMLTITGAGTVVVTATQAAEGNYLQGTATENITVNQAADTLTIGAVGTQTYPVSTPIALSATGASTGAITYSVTGPATVAGNLLTITGAGTVVVTANQAADGNYLAGTATESITVNQAADTLTIGAIPIQTYPVASPITLSATGSSTGAITYTASGPATVSGSTLTITGAGTVVVTATQAAEGNYQQGTATENITVNKAADTLTLGAVPTQTYPVSSTIALSATGASTGAITYSVTGPATVSGNTLTITGAGTVVVTANQAADSNYLAGTATENITVNQAADTLTIGAVATQTYPVSSPIALSATGPSTGAITYTVTGPATVSGNLLTITGAGTVVVTATQAAAGNYLQGTATESITVTNSSQTISFALPASASYGSTLTLSASSSASLPVTLTLVSGPATLVGNQLTLTGLGKVTVKATQAGNASINAAAPVTVSLTVVPAVLTVTANNLTETYGAVDPDSCGNVNRHLTYTVTGYVNGQSSSILSGSPNETTSANPSSGVGTYTITITQGQLSLRSSDYTLVFVNGTLTVTPAALTVTASSASMTYGATVPSFSASISGFVNNDRSSVVHGTASASTTATSSSDPGTYPVVPNLSALSAANYTFVGVNGTLTINQASQSITFGSVGSQTAPGTLALAATASSGLAVVYTVTGPATLSGSTLSLTSAGTVTVTASQPGNVDYSAAKSVTQSFTVTGAKKSQTITVNLATPPVGGYTYGGTVALNATASSSLTVSYTVTGPATVSSSGVVTFTGAGTVTVTLNQSGNSSYNAATAVKETFTVSAAVLTVTATSQSVVYGAVDPDSCGNVNRHVSYTVSGFVNGQSSSILSGSPTETTTAKPTSGVGSYPITITQGSLSTPSGYTFVFVNGTETVTPATLTVAAARESKNLGQANPALTYTISGFVNNDSQSVVSGAPALNTTATTNSPAGIYVITISQGSLKAANYTFTFVNGALVVANCNSNSDPHCNGRGGYQQNDTWDCAHWPDATSYNYWWGGAGH